MIQRTQIVGVDPGLVHTGVVAMEFLPASHSVWVHSEAIIGPDSAATEDWIAKTFNNGWPHKVFVEKYKSRSHLSSDERMMQANVEFATLRNSKLLLNYGVKKVVTQRLMELLGVWRFPLVTHHQDLRSAARIALLGMLKNDEHNALLTTIVQAHLAGSAWTVHH